jgi:hypothetical protein
MQRQLDQRPDFSGHKRQERDRDEKFEQANSHGRIVSPPV